MLSAAERVVLGTAIRSGGFVSERDLNNTQVRTARMLVPQGLLSGAGYETDRTPVYQVTAEGRERYEGGI